MRRTQPVKIGDIVSDFFRNSPHIARKLAEARAIDLWSEAVGGDLARYTTRINITNGRMFVYVSSSVARHELFMQRRAIIEKLNDLVGEKVVDSIILK